MTFLDDVLFISTLLVCIALGSYYKKIDNVVMKRNYGAGLGILVTCVVCGEGFLHTVFLVWGNIIIIKCCDKRYVHQMSMAYTWIYLVYLHFNMSSSMYAVWIYQTIALRLVGLAFETYLSNGPHSELDILSQEQFQEPTAADIIVYGFFFVGLHKGPYYRWKIFKDHFKAPFGILGDCRVITEHKLKKALLCALAYLILQHVYSPEAYFYEEFYRLVGSESRYLYNVPQLVIFFLRTQVVMMLCTSVCTETGFGVYPAKCSPMPGYGPTAGASLLKLASTKANVALQQEYNFAMLKCFDNKKLLLGPKMRHTFEGYHMATRYWFRTYIYKQLRASKEIRSACTFGAWWMWSGPSPHRLMMTATLWVYLFLEDEYSELLANCDIVSLDWQDKGFSIMRILCLLYLTPCIILQDTIAVFRYYNSIYWIYHFIMLMLVVAVFILNKHKINT